MAKKAKVKRAPSRLEAELARRIAREIRLFKERGVKRAEVFIVPDNQEYIRIGEVNFHGDAGSTDEA